MSINFGEIIAILLSRVFSGIFLVFLNIGYYYHKFDELLIGIQIICCIINAVNDVKVFLSIGL